ncbi:MAG: glycosyltransferase [Candidatus Babeliales bacterium]|nr:glycosyltransferase [Candidatus Babeliales bacterium]
MKLQKKLFLFLIVIAFKNYSESKDINVDLNLISFIKFSDGLGQIPISFISTLHKDIHINFVNSREFWLWPADLPVYITDIISKTKKINEIKPKSISIYTDTLDVYSEEYLQKQNQIKFSYSLVEGTRVPVAWVERLNKHFDGVLVGDEYLVDVYKSSGVKIPIFVLPIALNLDVFLKQEKRKSTNPIFTFGFSAGFGESKNHKLLVQAFCEEFAYEKNVVKLKLHGRQGHYYEEVKKCVESYPNFNIELLYQTFSRQEYIEFLLSLDSYVILSKGEGFSITPRESLALGLPTIVSNNTCQKTICNSGFVYSVKSDIKEPHITVDQTTFGFDFNCEIKDARRALREVYNNYEYYSELAQKGRHWANQYSIESMRNKYLNLVKPKKIVFGKHNIISKNFFMTSSKELYKKYMELYK